MPHLAEFAVHLPYASGLPRDVAINVFHVCITDALAADGTALAAATAATNTALENFYNVASGSEPIAWYLSPFIDRSHAYITQSNLSSNALGSGGGAVTYTPVASEPFVLGAPGGHTPLPLEMAVVSSLRGMDTFPSAPFPAKISRRRGRIYVGPFSTTVLAGTADVRPQVSSGARESIGLSTKTLCEAIAAIDGAALVVWSKTERGCSIITEGYVNDEPDTQRRRGSGELARMTWSF